MKPINLARIAVFFCLFTRMAAAGVMYGVAPFRIGTQSTLYRIDPSTGAATSIGSLGFERFGGLAFNAAGVLYGYTPGALYTIDPATGAATRVGPLGTQAPEGGLAFHPTTGVLFGFDGDDDSLITINPMTGAASAVGPMGAAGRDTSGLAFLPDGRLLGVALSGGADRLIEINPATGFAITIGALGSVTGVPSVGGLEFHPSNSILYYSDGANLCSVNDGTGAATLIGPHSVVEMAGLAAAIPEPAMLTFLVIGLAALRRRRF